ncbi:hypothetical protein Glove_216g13 [Diversispora epigaea]|uniref:Uncharacterized protein n=1 Tax=Diversispora epigaea TaxID=1348612 RepID=A0A397IRM2_9GLOM|nr:hypothetical protein Glove_216g13 [Diversispora epigaea]
MAKCKRYVGSGKMKCGSRDGSGYVVRTEKDSNEPTFSIFAVREMRITCPGPCKGKGE